MPVPKLSDPEIARKLQTLSGWARTDHALWKTYTFPDFTQAMRFVNRAAEMAEAVQHHPDMDIRYRKVTLTLSTHDSGGITQKDMAYAAAADDLADAATP